MPGMDINAAALKAVAAVLIQLASAVTDDGAQTVRQWRQSQDYYIAPESPALLGALDPLILRGRQVGDRIAGLQPVLDHYADEADRIITEIRRLEANPATDPAERADQERRITELKAELDALEAATATKIRALFAANLVPERQRVSEEVVSASFALSGGLPVGGISLGQNATLKITRFSDETLQVTLLHGQQTGGSLQAGKFVELGGGLNIEAGSTWKFQDEAEYTAFKGELVDLIGREQWRLDPDGGAVGAAIADQLRPPRPADIVITEAAIPLSASGALDKIPWTDLGLQADGTFARTVAEDRATGGRTETISREYAGEGSGAAAPRPSPGELGSAVGPDSKGGLSGGGGLGSKTGAARDANGQLTRVILTTVERGNVSVELGADGKQERRFDPDAGRHRKDDDVLSGGVVDDTSRTYTRVTMTVVPVSTPEERAVAEEFLAGENNDPLGSLDDGETYYPERKVPGDAFQNLAFRNGTSTVEDFADVTRSQGGSAGVDAGAEAGLEAGVDSTRSERTGNTYLRPAGPNEDLRQSGPTP